MSHPRVLLVDDEAQILDLLERLLDKHGGYALATAHDPFQAVEILKREDFDVLVTDLIMPGMSGLQLIREAKALHPRVVAIVLTGHGSRDATISAIKEGVFDYIEKPIIEPQAFYLAIDRATAQSRLARERDQLLLDLQSRNADLQQSLSRLGEAYERLRRQEENLESDLTQAQRIQQALLPADFPFIKGIDLFGFFCPCERMGGDFFDVIPLGPDRAAVYLADVAGHGVGAAMITVIIREMIQSARNQDDADQVLGDPARALAFLNQGICAETFQPPLLVTMGYFVVDGARGELTCSCAGHPPPILVANSTGGGFVSAGGPVLGLLASPEFDVGRIAFKRGDFLLLHSDGLSEARDSAGLELGGLEIARRIAPWHGRSARDVAARVEDVWRRHTANVPSADDVTFVVFSACPRTKRQREKTIPDSVRIASPSAASGTGAERSPCHVKRGWSDKRLVIALLGKATWQEAPILREAIDEARRLQAPSIHLDLSECSSLDSTALGVLCQVAKDVQVHRPTERVVRQLREMGVYGLLRIVGEAPPPADLVPAATPPPDLDRASETILSAHEALMKTIPENRARFQSAVDLIRKPRKAQPPADDAR